MIIIVFCRLGSSTGRKTNSHLSVVPNATVASASFVKSGEGLKTINLELVTTKNALTPLTS